MFTRRTTNDYIGREPFPYDPSVPAESLPHVMEMRLLTDYVEARGLTPAYAIGYVSQFNDRFIIGLTGGFND